MKLASRRFSQAHMGAEMHAATPEQLEWVMAFRPWSEAPVVLHLPRHYNLTDELTRRRIYEFASRFCGGVSGMVLHDHKQIVQSNSAYIDAAREMNRQLLKLDPGPVLFIEYAVGLEPSEFATFFAQISDLDRLAPCIDIGHVGIKAALAAYARNHDGHDASSLKSQPPELRELIADVQSAVRSGRSAVFDLIQAIAAVQKPVHFHLHDGHPLSTFSPFGVSDHLSFLTEIPLNFVYRDRRSVPPMFGPEGLAELVCHVLRLVRRQQVSFTLEIQPTGERLALGQDGELFSHWTDKINAERTNHWLSVLSSNHELLRRTISGRS